MPELRRDPVIGRWVIISTDRSRRPTDFSNGRDSQVTLPCPFCPGNEDKTPPEIMTYGPAGRLPDKPGWWLRVVPNKYPALQIEGQLHRTGGDLYEKMDGLGAHEIVIETDDHKRQIEDLEDDRLIDVFRSYKERIVDLKKDARFEYILVFKNRGASAGATLFHSHSQLIATPMVPIRVKQEMRGADDYFEKKGNCIYCDILRLEHSQKDRVVDENEDFSAIAPFASRFPFEICILPKKHDSNFESLDKAGMGHLSRLFKSVLKRLNRVLDSPAYNFVIHTAPLKSSGLAHFHWHLELMPKLVQTAGFEWGTGFYINPTPPELAARYLREINSQ